MDEAKIRETAEIVTGEDLWYMNQIDTKSFECIYCGVDYIACSFIQNEHKRRPYFRLHNGTIHKKDNCAYQHSDAIKLKGQEQRLTTEDGFPLPYPSKFKLPKPLHAPNLTTLEGGDLAEPTNTDLGGKASLQYQGPNQQHQYVTDSFRAIVSHYVNFPNDRSLSLEFEGVIGNTYQSCFKSLIQPSLDQKPIIQEINKINLTVASWKSPTLDGNLLQIVCNNGLWVDKKPIEKFIIEINVAYWPKRAVNAFLYEYKKALHEIRGKKGKKLLIFFLGEQDTQDNLYRFFANDYRLLTIKVVS
ncbi:MAG: hypothetical protein ACI9C9_002879 [Marivirga sp.]|jgi:hypothetical protein